MIYYALAYLGLAFGIGAFLYSALSSTKWEFPDEKDSKDHSSPHTGKEN